MRVSAWLQRWSVIVFIVLLPLLAYSAWDAVEAARVRSRVDALRHSGAPTSLPYILPSGPAEDAERYYRASAALVHPSDPTVAVDVDRRMSRGLRAGEWTPEVIATARQRIELNREALDYADRAAALPFIGFRPGTSYNFRVADLSVVARLCEVRAAVLASEANGDGAVASFQTEARLARALDDAANSTPPFGAAELTAPAVAPLPSFTGLSFVMGRTRPSAGLRTALGANLAELDRDERMREAFLRARTMMLDTLFVSRPPSSQPRALTALLTVRALDGFSAILAASEKPWPDRIAAVDAVGIWPQPNLFALGERSAQRLRDLSHAVADQVKRLRCARLLVSGTPMDVIDPFSGRRLEADACHL
jgi:hypothetical protein